MSKFKVGNKVKFDENQRALVKMLAGFSGELEVVEIKKDLEYDKFVIKLENGIYYPEDWIVLVDETVEPVENLQDLEITKSVWKKTNGLIYSSSTR